MMDVKKGDVYRFIQSGGGGYGDPLERDPMSVLNDVCQEKVTLERAVEYGVVLVGDVPEVDFEKTKKLRTTLRKNVAHCLWIPVLLRSMRLIKDQYLIFSRVMKSHLVHKDYLM